jgi:HAD superfamily hydrolase (TIGR01509 family)
MNKKKFILFDLGGIFVPDNTRLLNQGIASHLGISKEEMIALWNDALPELFTGRMKIIDFYESRFGNRYDSNVLLQMHLEIYTRGFKINPLMLELLKKLNLKHTTACLSNTEIEVSDVNRKLKLYEHFQYEFLSTEMRMMKPNADIFISAVQKLNASNEDIIFIDDKEENVKAASLLGLKTILFENVDETKELLYKYLNV